MRVLAYIQAFCALRPHRACSVSDAPLEALLQEPLFFDPRIRGPECGAPLSGFGWRPVAEAGVRRVGDLRRLLTEALPPGDSSGQRSVLLAALPQVWRAALNSDINLDSLEWLIGAAAHGDAAAWRHSGAAPKNPKILAKHSDHLQPCVSVASSRHSPCVCAVGLCVAWQTCAFLALWPSVSACVRARCSVLGTPFLALSFGRGAVTEVLHALRCGLALSPVRHDLPCNQKKKTSSRQASPPGAAQACSRKPNKLMPGEV